MIKLFEEKNEYVLISGENNSPVFNVSSNEKINLLISWNDIKFKKITINIKGNVSLLEIGENILTEVEINVLDDSFLNHSIAFFGNGIVSNYKVNLSDNAIYNGALADFTTGRNRFDYICSLKGQGAEARWNLATLSSKKDIKDFYVSFYHYAKHTYAKMENYGVCEDNAVLNFLGTSSIIKGAKSSATHQSAKIMVFDPSCKAKASPTLCIAENDVEASHAAVVGQINEEHVFYLTSRGIPAEQAKKLITLGYLNPILRFFDEYKDESVYEQIKNRIEGDY